MADDSDDTNVIERDLAETRARMDRRLDALQDRLSPGQIANDALAYVQGGDGADFARDLVARVKANPLPAVVTGVGLAWLMASERGTAAAAHVPDRPVAASASSGLTDPIVFGTLAVAAGLVAGLLIPTSGAEARRISRLVANPTGPRLA